jgi:hypothetical protein
MQGLDWASAVVETPVTATVPIANATMKDFSISYLLWLGSLPVIRNGRVPDHLRTSVTGPPSRS